MLASLLGVGAVAPFVRGSRDVTGDSVLLRYTAHIPNSHGLYGKVFLPWEEIVTERTGGRIRTSSTSYCTGPSTDSRRLQRA